jgi:mono/diheme cytochrome c family protein
LPNGRLPAPPHDGSGHTWHHAVPPYAPPGYESDMPAFGTKLSDDEIWALLAFIKSYWRSREVLEARKEMTATR